MVDTFGEALRGLRIAAGFRSLAAFAVKVNYSKGYLGNIETGERQPTADLAEACDRALGTAPLLSMLLEQPGGNDVKRRALLGSIGMVTGASAVIGPSALADLVRHGFLDAVTGGEDWDAVVDDVGRRFVADPSPDFGASLLAQLLILRQKIADSPQDRDLHRAAAGLGQFYGLWLGNQGKLHTAHNWYRTAAVLADRAGDLSLRSFVRGRSLARGIYEGYSVKQTLSGVDEVLSLTSTPTTGAMEAHAARVHVYALTGDVREGRKAIVDMRTVVDELPDEELQTLAAPHARTTFLNAFLECRVGSLADAEAACEAAFPELAEWPLWLAETRVYLGRAMVAAGNVGPGISYALKTMQTMRHDVRVIGVAVRDVVSVVPEGYQSSELDHLRAFADPKPGPWETLH
ncbi:helix-turn-helix transcriptional regulator [Dactylosporangium sp. NPDC051485]|uniref:helix-turn-helix domain-containing protein n=1 Tax=Dactylosporangium sp. NPDC051485 TaxID=3154846 RepID=UPI00343E6663